MVTLHIVVNFRVSQETLLEPFSISTLFGDPVIASWLKKNGVVTVSQKITSTDLEELKMLNYDIILGMESLHDYYASFDCNTRFVRF